MSLAYNFSDFNEKSSPDKFSKSHKNDIDVVTKIK